MHYPFFVLSPLMLAPDQLSHTLSLHQSHRTNFYLLTPETLFPGYERGEVSAVDWKLNLDLRNVVVCVEGWH